MRRLPVMILVLVGVILLGGCPLPPESTGGEAVGLRPEPPTPAPTAAPPTSRQGRVAWLASLDEALQRSQLLDRPILVDFYADWCGPCKMMDERTWVDAAVVAETARFICVKLNVDEEPTRAQQFGVRAVPTIAFVTPAGQIVNRATGFMEPRDLLRLMRKVR